MTIIVLGDGPLGNAVAAAARERGQPITVLGRPTGDGHDPVRLAGADVVVDATRGPAVLGDVEAATRAGVRRLVLATTGWDADRTSVESMLREAGAAAVAAPNFSLGMSLFGRLVDEAAVRFGAIAEFDPFLVEWHRRGKADRPSGTARALAARLRDAGVAIHDTEVASIRAGASPGMHLVGWDAPGETVELRLTARDRSAYGAGILASADWLRRSARTPGLHPFDAVVDELLLARSAAAA